MEGLGLPINAPKKAFVQWASDLSVLDVMPVVPVAVRG